jgi:hypothetical protein
MYANGMKNMEAELTPPPMTPVSRMPLTPVTRITAHKPAAIKPGDEVAVLKRGLEEGDDKVVLQALHVEVTAVADRMLRQNSPQARPAWEIAGSSGWAAAKRDVLGLQPIEAFYELAETYNDIYASGGKASDLKRVLADGGFSKKLLAMREMFLRCRNTL